MKRLVVPPKTHSPAPNPVVVAVALLAAVASGILLRFHLPVAEVIRDAAGGVAYVVAVALGLLLLCPRLSPFVYAALAFAITCGVEFSQLIAHPWLDAIRATRLARLARLALGTTFSWTDFGPYVVGALLAWLVIRLLPRHSLP